MLSYEQGLELATKKLNEVSENDPDYLIWEKKTVVKEYGWIFFPATKAYISSGDPMSLVPGISPILVNKHDATCIMAPSSISLELFIQDYEQKLK